jgi:hypothetical protein
MKMFVIIVLSACAGILPGVLGTASGQEIESTVTLSMDNLTPSQKDYLAEFQSKLTTYINEHRWTNVDFRGDKIPVNISIFFTAGTDGGDFSAQAVIESQRRLYLEGRPTQDISMIFRVNDKKWSFTYMKGQPFYHDEYQFNDITSFIDFYMNVILGLDFDSYEMMQGTPYYQKASTIAQRSQSSNRVSEWQGSSNDYSRINLIGELQNAQYANFRSSLYWYYYEGLDYLQTEKDEAQKSIARALEDVADILARTNVRSLLLNMWLEFKCEEFCTKLEGYAQRPQLMNTMAQADPQRQERYRKCSF